MTRTEKKHKHLNIRWQLFGYMAGFTIIVVIMLWLLQIVFLEDIYKSIKVKEIKATASEISVLAKKPLNLENDALEIARDNNICIIGYRIEESGKATELISCDVVANCAIHDFSVSEILEFYGDAQKSGGSSLCYYIFELSSGRYQKLADTSEIKGPETLVYTFIVKDSRDNDIVFILNSFVSPVNATVTTLNYLIGIIGITMIITALILTIILSRNIAKPITELNESAKRLAHGDYDISFNGGSYREINELAGSLSYAASELSKTDRLRSELIANTSHDLRTPLTMIAGYAEVMRDIPDENTPENAQIIIDEAKRLTSLVNDMLDISKLESGNYTIDRTEFNLTEAISSELERYQELCRREGYKIVFNYDRKITVASDRQKLIQALLNLVNNALTYTGKDRLVTVEQNVFTDENDGKLYVRLSVTDTGDGIPEDKLELIWDRYYKVDSHHKRSSYGSGLGLSIVRNIVTLINGRCGVMSSQGKGSSFWIDIPVQ